MKKQDIITILQNGIGEVTYTDEYSVEHSIMATLSPLHLPDEDSSGESSGLMLSVFNVNSEEWQLIPFGGIIDIEQLTGHGAEANKNKLESSIEYMKQLELFAEDSDEESEPDSEDLE
jgi:hypothetical protein